MAAERRGHGDDSIYLDQTNARWVGSISLGCSPDGKRKRRTVRAKTKTEVRDKLRSLREDIATGVQAPADYTVRQAVEDSAPGRPASQAAKESADRSGRMSTGRRVSTSTSSVP
jgi:hypothetical protein